MDRIYGATINGKLTVSENVADLEELPYAWSSGEEWTQISQQKNSSTTRPPSMCMKGRPEFIGNLWPVDAHAPAKPVP